MLDRLELERALWARGLRRIAGTDEAGRGPLAGPVVAAAAMFPEEWIERGLPGELEGLNDSKQLGEGARERFYEILTSDPRVRWAIEIVPPAVIDEINILRASLRAMAAACARLGVAPDHVLVDGNKVFGHTPPQTAVVKGDARSQSVAAASVLAKVARDRLMVAYDVEFPGYGFAVHKGYPTPAHLAALERLGPCAIHRMSFAPLRREARETDFLSSLGSG